MDAVEEYRNKIYDKLNINNIKNKIVLDLGCGSGLDALWFRDNKRSFSIASDIQKDEMWPRLKKIPFFVSDARRLPLKNNSVDCIFIKDTLHHVDNYENIIFEIKRVMKKGAKSYIIESNRYNPISYVSLVKLRGHSHLSQSVFKKKIKEVFPNVKFVHFENHVYPVAGSIRKIIRVFEKIIDKIPLLRYFMSYNLAIVSGDDA